MGIRMFSYGVTATGPEGFRVNATHSEYGTHLIGSFHSLGEAKAFAEKMRNVDAGASHGAADYRIENLIRRNHELCALAAAERTKSQEHRASYIAIRERLLETVRACRPWCCVSSAPSPEARSAAPGGC